MIISIYILGTISLISLILFIIGLCLCSGSFEDWPMWFFGTWLISMILCVGLYVLRESKEPKFSLNKADWECIKEHTFHYTTTILIGKVVVPQFHTEVICDNYKRK